MGSKFLNVLSVILVIVGALNWGLWGFFQFDFIAWIAKGNMSSLARLIYGVIGLAGVWAFRLFVKKCGLLCSCGCNHDDHNSEGSSQGHSGGCCKK